MGMWLALLAAVFAAFTAILGKIGMKNIESSLGTAIRTTIVLVFTFIMVMLFSDLTSIKDLTTKNYIYLTISGLSTAVIWLCYYHALTIGNVNKVVPIDKLSIIMTIYLSVLIFEEEALTYALIIGSIFIGIGSILMIDKEDVDPSKKTKATWFIYALVAAIFSAFIPILNKMGLRGVDKHVALFYRVAIVFIVAWLYAGVRGKVTGITSIKATGWIFLGLSSICTGLSWIFGYSALQIENVALVSTIDKTSVVMTILLSWVILREKLTLKAFIGCCSILAGTLFMIFL